MSDLEPEPLCEFTNPCTTEDSTTSSKSNKRQSKNPRKVISHIFGRNKTSTKLFPTSVWVHYCRKHYQRARYRSTQWPFTQCELLLDSLDRMEKWGGVGEFEVVLRRREVERVERVEGGRCLRSASRSQSGNGRVLREQQEEEGLSTGSSSGSISSTLTYMSLSDQTNDNNNRDQDQDQDYEDPGSRRPKGKPNTNNNPQSKPKDHSKPNTNNNPQSKPKGHSKPKSKQRKKPAIEPSPVPGWLRQEVGANKSFNDIRAIMRRLQDYLTHLREQGRRDEIRFPDIEILPSFQGWVLHRARNESGDNGGDGGSARGRVQRRRGQTRAGRVRRTKVVSRVGRRGAVQKV